MQTTSLRSLITNGEKDGVKIFLESLTIDKLQKQIDNLYCYGINCRTPIHIATLNKDLEMVKLLLDFGANINSKTEKYERGISDEGGLTPLDIAYIQNDHEMINFLITRDAIRGRPGVTQFLSAD
jgi:ankyrin repeat protein